jgi:hypothetical protein
MMKTGVKVELDVGGLVSSAARGESAVESLNNAIKQLREEGKVEEAAQLQWRSDNLSAQNSQVYKDIKNYSNDPRFQSVNANGATVFKMDSEYESRTKDLSDSIKSLSARIQEAVNNDGDMALVTELSGQLQTQQAEFHKVMQAASAPETAATAKGAQDVMKAIGAGQIVNGITDGISRWVSSLDRSGIVSKQGSGDVIGAQIDETRRKGDLYGGIAETAFGIAGGALSFINPLLGVGVTALGKLVSPIFDAEANEMATHEAYAQNWEKQAPASMELSALLGGTGGDYEENTRNLREAFNVAAKAASEFGYSVEEGIEVMKEAAYQGLNEGEAAAAAQNVFDYQRGTGADRGALTSLEMTTRRYGVNDALGTAWAGNQASGMETGQYTEYLRAFQRIFEDGIAKGFTRSSKEIATDLTLMSQMAGGSELWKGEQGARRYEQMSSGLAGTTGLSSATDILAFRSAQAVLAGENGDNVWKQIADLDDDGVEDIKRSGTYIDDMVLLERGLRADTFKETMNTINDAEGGNRTESIERIRGMYGLDYTNSSMIYDQMFDAQGKERPGMNEAQITELLDKYGTAAPKHDTAETGMFEDVQEIRRLMANMGQHYTDEKIPQIYEQRVEKWKEASDLGVTDDPKPAPPPGYIPPPVYTPATDEDIAGLSPVETEKLMLEKLQEAMKSGNQEEQNQAWKNVEKAQMDVIAATHNFEDPLDQETRMRGEIGNFAGLLFSPSISSGQSKEERKADAKADKQFTGMLYNDLNSGNETQRARVQEALSLFNMIPKDVFKSMDKDQSANALVNNGMDAFLAILREIANNTREAAEVHIEQEL